MRGARDISPEHRAKLREHIAKINAKPLDLERLAKLKDHISKINAKRALGVEVTNVETGETVKYESMRQAAREIGTTRERLRTLIKNNTLFKGKYKISNS
jgi:hypothetical protein